MQSGSSMNQLSVSDLMTSDVEKLTSNNSVLEAYDLMAERHFRHLPIVDEDDALVGLVTERDLLRHVLAQVEDMPLSEQRQLLETIKIAEVMNSDPEFAEPGDDLASAGRTLIEQKFGCLPVCEGNKLVGILTETDFVKHVVSSD